MCWLLSVCGGQVETARSQLPRESQVTESSSAWASVPAEYRRYFRFVQDRSGFWTRMRKFHITAAGGFVINYALLWSVTEFLCLHYLLSNLVGIMAAFLWNYCVNVKWTWR